MFCSDSGRELAASYKTTQPYCPGAALQLQKPGTDPTEHFLLSWLLFLGLLVSANEKMKGNAEFQRTE